MNDSPTCGFIGTPSSAMIPCVQSMFDETRLQMNNHECQPEDYVLGYTAFAMSVAGVILPFFANNPIRIGSLALSFFICEGLAVYLEILGRRTRIARIAWRSAFLFVAIALAAIVLQFSFALSALK